MLDIPGADKMKLKYKIFLHFFLKEAMKKAKELGLVNDSDKKIIEVMHDDLRNCTNYPIRKLYMKMMESASCMGEKYQASVITELGAPILWILYRDTAYRDPFFWMLNELIDDPDMQKNIGPYVKPPGMWYCPNWKEAKDSSRNKVESGELTRFDMSEEEKFFVPKLQYEKQEKILRDKAKEFNWDKIVKDTNEYMRDGKRKI